MVLCSLPKYSTHVRELVYPADFQLPQPCIQLSGLITFFTPNLHRHTSDHILRVVDNNKNQLQTLDISFSGLALSLKAIKTLAGLKNLQTLSLRAVNIPNGAIELILDGAPGLEYLHFREYKNPPRTEATALVPNAVRSLLNQNTCSSSLLPTASSPLLSYRLKELKVKTDRTLATPVLSETRGAGPMQRVHGSSGLSLHAIALSSKRTNICFKRSMALFTNSSRRSLWTRFHESTCREGCCQGANLLKDTLENLIVNCDDSQGLEPSPLIVSILQTFKKLKRLDIWSGCIQVRDLFDQDPFLYSEDEDEDDYDEEGNYIGEHKPPLVLYDWACKDLKSLNILILRDDEGGEDERWYPKYEDLKWGSYERSIAIMEEGQDDSYPVYGNIKDHLDRFPNLSQKGIHYQ
ncbi:hypothetical protein BGZ83_006292 [Gryganskiella cystojenkinii]|nr:hypothetical protein BGZ83_006292 [Gryganskiella cystojenkinii]